MKKTAVNILIALGAIIGILLILYPHIAFALAQCNASYITENYEHTIEQWDEKAVNEELDKAAAYNATLYGASVEDPFIAGSGMVLPDNYTSVLNINGVMGRVQIPKIKVDLPIFHGTSDQTLQKGAGHLEGTSLPIGKEGSHAAITGHTGLNTAKMFTDLALLNLDDEFYLHIMDRVFAYRINQIEIVTPDNVEMLKPVKHKDYVTLITCTPYSINSHRLLVRGERVEYTPQQVHERINGTKAVISKETLFLIISLGTLCTMLVVTALVNARLRRKAVKIKESNKQRSKYLYKKNNAFPNK